MLDHTEMNNAIKSAYSNSIRKEGQVVNISEYSDTQLRNLANEIRNADANIFNAKARDFADRLINRRLWTDEYPGLKNLRDNHLKNKYGDINITIQESNSTKSLTPYLQLK